MLLGRGRVSQAMWTLGVFLVVEVSKILKQASLLRQDRKAQGFNGRPGRPYHELGTPSTLFHRPDCEASLPSTSKPPHRTHRSIPTKDLPNLVLNKDHAWETFNGIVTAREVKAC